MSVDQNHGPARIHPLPLALANQIAAGEVVERPASVVKELVENSLDAGARRVEVEVEEAGVRLLRVRDDGAGIHPEDLALALARHATSKLRTVDDLLRVASLGFRGEALPSVASVSRLTLASRTAGQDRGWQVRVDGGGPVEGPTPVAHPPGTTVEVRDLFHNVPARRKFLKSPRTESAHVEDVVRRLALARFDVGLRLRVDRREVLDLRSAGDAAAEARRVAAVCGAAFLAGSLRLDLGWEGMRLAGWIGLPEAARSQADVQYLFLNGRPVRDRVLVHALREAYGDRLYPGRHPAYVLYLTVDPEQVDVNVHPTKQEVRFREARLVHDFVARAVGRVFDRSPEEADQVDDGPAGDLFGPVPSAPAGIDGPARAREVALGLAAGDDARGADGPPQAGAGHGPGGAPGEARDGGGDERARLAGAWAGSGRGVGRLGGGPGPLPGRAVGRGAGSPATPHVRDVPGVYGRGVSESWLRRRLSADTPPAPERRVLAVAHGRFLIAQSPAGLTLVDLQALAGTLARRGLEAALAGGDPPSRPLLIPVVVAVGAPEAHAAETHGALCAALGLDLSRSGPAAVLVRRLPAALHDADPAALASAVLGALAAAGPAATPAVVLEAAVGVAGQAVPADPATLEVLLRALDAVAAGEWPAGVARELTPAALQGLLAAPDGSPGPVGAAPRRDSR